MVSKSDTLSSNSDPTRPEPFASLLVGHTRRVWWHITARDINTPMTQGVWHNGKGKIGKLNFVRGTLKRIMIDVGGGWIDVFFLTSFTH